MEQYEGANCPDCGTDEWNVKTAQILDHDFFTEESTGTVGGVYEIKISVDCKNNHTLFKTLKFYPASCTNPKTDCRREKTQIIHTSTKYLKNPSGFHKPGYGWLVIDECEKCGRENEWTCTVRGVLLGKLKSIN